MDKLRQLIYVNVGEGIDKNYRLRQENNYCLSYSLLDRLLGAGRIPEKSAIRRVQDACQLIVGRTNKRLFSKCVCSSSTVSLRSVNRLG